MIECIIIPNCYYGYMSGFNGPHLLMFRFFTEDSNILLGLSSLLYLLGVILTWKSDKPLPSWVKRIRFIATTATTTTFMVVFFFLTPVVMILYNAPIYSMWSFPNMFFTHFICPVLAIVSFIFFEEKEEFKYPLWREAFYAIITVVIYATVVGTLASLHLISSDESINNVYGFMDATYGAWWETPLAFLLIVSGTYGEGFLLLYFQKKHAKRIETKSQENPC